MKKGILISIFLIVCQNTFGQDYHFDYYYEFESDRGINFFMLNSVNDQYAFVGRNKTEGFEGYIIDFNRKERHSYEVKNIKNAVHFDYTNSEKINSLIYNEKEINVKYDIAYEQIDSTTYKNVVVKNEITKKGTKKYQGEAELIYSENDNFIFHSILLKYYANHFFNKQDISFLGNKLPKTVKLKYKNGTILCFNLTNKKKIETLLSISKEQLEYKQ